MAPLTGSLPQQWQVVARPEEALLSGCAGLALLVTEQLDPGFSHIWLKARVHELGYLQSVCPGKGSAPHLPPPRLRLSIHRQGEKCKLRQAGALAELVQNTGIPSCHREDPQPDCPALHCSSASAPTPG